MYRSLGTLTTFGVPSGPYTGPARRVLWRDMPPAARERLRAVLDGRSRPAPIAMRIPRALRLARWLGGLALVGTLALTALVVHAWPSAQPRWFAALYALSLAPFVGMAAFLAHRRLVRGGAPIDPGQVLLPLDLVTCDGHALTIQPLGSVRDVGVVSEGGASGALRLVLRFDSGDEASFPMPSTAHANRAYDALLHAQRTLEELSYGDHLASALEHDPFFSMRSEGGFEGMSSDPPPRSPASSARQGAVSAAIAVVVSSVLGQVAFSATARFSDELRFREAFSDGSEVAMRRYLERGGLRVVEAHYFLGSRKMNLRKDHELSSMRERVARNEGLREATSGPETATNPPGFSRPRTPHEWGLAHAECLRALTDRAPRPLKASSALPLLIALSDEARRGDGGPAHLEVRYERLMQGDARAAVPAEVLEARERELTRALAIVLSEVCPPSVLDVRLARAPRQAAAPALVVRYDLKKPVPRRFGDASFTLSEIRFDVTLEVWPKKPVGFSLTMPPPELASDVTRERSLFRVDPAAPLRARVMAAYTARAFDRLYDEIYGLFFHGDVKVPLPGFAEVERIFMK